MTADDRMDVTTHEGVLPDGTKHLTQVPVGWNGTLLLYSYGPPSPPEAPAWPASNPLVQAFLRRGYAIAGCGTTVFWPLEQNLPNQIAVLDLFAQTVGRPHRTIAWGQSIGGLMTAALVQFAPERLDGALVLCGTLGGGVGTHNQQLDCTFTFKTLLAPNSDLQPVNITNPGRNAQVGLAILDEAQATPEGRARLGLAAAFGSIPGWFDPTEPEPAADDFAARELNQYAWMQRDWPVFLSAKVVLEHRGGGNLSWNTGVDYRQLLAASPSRPHVEALYWEAGLDLEADLETLDRAPRIEADPHAVDYFERYIAFNGSLRGVPVVTLHLLGDGLVPVDHMRSYGDVVRWAGQEEFLRQLYIARGGHCFFTTAEVLTSFDGLTERIEHGAWPDLDSASLNAAAAALSPADQILPPHMTGTEDPDRSGHPVAPAFVDFTPTAFARPHDARHVEQRRSTAGPAAPATG